MATLVGGPFDGQKCTRQAATLVVRWKSVYNPLLLLYAVYERFEGDSHWYCTALLDQLEKGFTGYTLLDRELVRTEYDVGGPGFFFTQYVKGAK